MEGLVRQLQACGLSTLQVEQTLLIIEQWLDESYPVLAKVYQTEILRKAREELLILEKEEERPTKKAF